MTKVATIVKMVVSHLQFLWSNGHITENASGYYRIYQEEAFTSIQSNRVILITPERSLLQIPVNKPWKKHPIEKYLQVLIKFPLTEQ